MTGLEGITLFKKIRMEGDKEGTTELGLFQLRSQLTILASVPSKSHGRERHPEIRRSREQVDLPGGDKAITEFWTSNTTCACAWYILPRLISLSGS